MQDETRYCKDCKWNPIGSNLCYSPNNDIDLVSGSTNVVRCETNRYNYTIGLCRAHGALFEPRPVEMNKLKNTLFTKIVTFFNKE